VFIMGGYLRDKLTSKQSFDIDFLLLTTEKETTDFLKELLEITKSDSCKNHPTNEGFNVYLFSNTLNQTKVDFFMDIPYKPGDSIQDCLVQSYKRRDFKMGALHMDVVSGKLIDIEGLAVSSIINKTINTVTDDYKFHFWRLPHTIYRVFRMQSALGYTIDPPMLEYIKKHWWLVNFAQIFHIKLETNRIIRGPHADLAIKNLKECKLDPTDLTRSDVYIGEDWNVCEPGREPNRVIDAPHARWTTGLSTIFVNDNVKEIELVADKNPKYNDLKEIEILYDSEYTRKIEIDKNRIKFPTLKYQKIQLKMPTFNPHKLELSEDNRDLGVYVRQIILHKNNSSQVLPIEHVPYYLQL